jgi:drug/metabolite transporter (DMT)-like permease
MHAIPFFLLLAVGAFIAVGINLSKAAAAYGIEGPEFAFWLSIGAGTVLLGLATLRGETIKLEPAHLRYYAVTGFVSLAAPNALTFILAKHAGAAYASVPYSLSPLITYPLAILVGLDRPEWRRFGGLAVGFVGTVLVLSRLALATADAGALWLLVALAIPLCLATGNIYRTLKWPKDMGDVGLAAAMMLASAIWLSPFMIAYPVVAFRAGFGAGELIVLAQIAAAAAMYWLYFWLQRAAGPVYLSQIGYVGAGFGVLFAVIFFREVVPPAAILGLLLIVAGVLLVRAVRQTPGTS